MRFLLLYLICCLSLFAWELDPKSTIGFKAYSWLETPEGKFHNFELANFDNKTLQGTLKIRVASVDTGSEGRDEHLIDEDFFHVERYPMAHIKVVKVDKAERTAFIVLTIKDIPKKYQVPITVQRSESLIRVTGSFSINRSHFEINYNSIFNRIQDKVDLSFELHLTKN